MKKQKLTFILIGVLIVAVFVIAYRNHKPASVPLQSIVPVEKLTNIVFKEIDYSLSGMGSNVWKQFKVSDSNELHRIVSMTSLSPKQPCKCAHDHEVEFQSLSAVVSVSFCNHCFDVYDGKNASNYAMPKEFYAEYQQFAESFSNSMSTSVSP